MKHGLNTDETFADFAAGRRLTLPELNPRKSAPSAEKKICVSSVLICG
jgi:hypothetical protein